MAIDENAIVLGLTGAFGSGCTTLAEVLESELRFANVKISRLIIQEWRRRAPAGNQPPLIPRNALQDLGDELRRAENPAYWVQLAVSQVDKQPGTVTSLVLDGIRNPGEIDWLRQRFKRFFQVAVDAPPKQRWARLQETREWRNRTREEFDVVSSRDIEAPDDWGQRVQQCVDLSDYVITNDQERPRPAAQQDLLTKANDLLQLCGAPCRRPTDEEVFMYIAWSTAKASACLKRNVGAAIVRPGATRQVVHAHGIGNSQQAASLVGIGYNENPDWMDPCHLEYKACYRDIWREKTWKSRPIAHCPYCKGSLAGVTWPYRCPNPDCSAGSLLDTFFPERAMTKCTALHAEERAILNCQNANLADCHLYCTTFPCFLCAQKILQSGIRLVTYVEPYPDKDSEELLQTHGINVKRFEGVKALAFGRFFENWRIDAERRFAERFARSVMDLSM